MEDRREKLAIALQEERGRLPEYSIFGSKNNLNNYSDAINFLKTGIKPINWSDNDLIDAIIYDFETICNDYDI
jgi:hypothetical protein